MMRRLLRQALLPRLPPSTATFPTLLESTTLSAAAVRVLRLALRARMDLIPCSPCCIFSTSTAVIPADDAAWSLEERDCELSTAEPPSRGVSIGVEDCSQLADRFTL